MEGPTYHVIIAGKLKAYRVENGLSQSEFGKLFGISAQAVCKWEREKGYPDIFFLPRLAQILGCKVDDFFETR